MKRLLPLLVLLVLAATATAGTNDPVPEPPATRPASGPRVLLVGGGSSHDFVQFFGATDKATLTPGVGWVDFTMNVNALAPVLKNIDVLVFSANQPISAEGRQALLDYANAGGGIVALHPGLWYSRANFPEWHLQIIGGGAKGHDKIGPYTVTVTNPASPITKDVPATFEIFDELYSYAADPAAAPIEVLATATTKSGKTYPQVFTVKHPKARVVGITLGHDGRAHDLPAFQTLLKNAVQWAAGK